MSRFSQGAGGVRPWDISPARGVEKTFMCVVFIAFSFSGLCIWSTLSLSLSVVLSLPLVPILCSDLVVFLLLLVLLVPLLLPPSVLAQLLVPAPHADCHLVQLGLRPKRLPIAKDRPKLSEQFRPSIVKEKLKGNSQRAKPSQQFFHSFWHFSTHFQTFSEFSEFFL